MTERGQIWKCGVCGNIVEILHKGASNLICCEKSMVLMNENSIDAAREKHIPVIEGKKVSVGSALHPMEEKHYIEWIEGVDSEGRIVKKFLRVEDEPVVEFCFEIVRARAYCNLHGLWRS